MIFFAKFHRIWFQIYLISFVQATRYDAVFYCALVFWIGCREIRSAWTTTVNAYILNEMPECFWIGCRAIRSAWTTTVNAYILNEMPECLYLRAWLRPSTDAGRASSYHDRYWMALVHPSMGADPGLLAQWRVRWRASSFKSWINLLVLV